MRVAYGSLGVDQIVINCRYIKQTPRQQGFLVASPSRVVLHVSPSPARVLLFLERVSGLRIHYRIKLGRLLLLLLLLSRERVAVE